MVELILIWIQVIGLPRSVKTGRVAGMIDGNLCHAHGDDLDKLHTCNTRKSPVSSKVAGAGRFKSMCTDANLSRRL